MSSTACVKIPFLAAGLAFRAEERFVGLAERDPDAAVRAVARRALGSLDGPSGVDGG
ncbi:hypothetical protein WME73_27520 [Sorangium sp. So ce302]|uniref:hypothetical protein n=1 Tax=Sorangium sp. So ce302 TaxID=3133297 RepID=UPI003F62D098